MPSGKRTSEGVRAEILRLRAQGLTCRVIAKRTGLHWQTVRRISENGGPGYTKAGRPRTGEFRKCLNCGKEIYVKQFEVERGRGRFCRSCANKLILPPIRVSGGQRRPAGLVCPKCGGRLLPHEDGLDCLACGKIVYLEQASEIKQ